MTMGTDPKTHGASRKRCRGQAVIELALTLPFLIWLIYYTINSFYTIHTSHIGNKYAAMQMYQRLNNRAQFVMDDKDNRLHNSNQMAVQYLDKNSEAPRRKILIGPIQIDNIVGICREPGC